MKRPPSDSVRHGSSLRQIVGGLLVGVIIGLVAYIVVTSEPDDSAKKMYMAGGIEDRKGEYPRRANLELATEFLEFPESDDPSQFIPLYAKLEETGHEELVQLIQVSRNLEPSSLAFELQQVLLGRLARVDPVTALEETWNFKGSKWTELIRVVFAEWAVLNLEDALTAACSLNGVLRVSAVDAILNVEGELHEEKLANMPITSGIESILERRIAEDMALGLLENPELAWKSVARDGVADEQQEELFLRIADEWLQSGSFDVLDHVYDDGLGDPFSASYELRHKIETLVAERNPERAFEYILGMPTPKQRAAAYGFLRQLAEIDPDTAFEYASRLSTRWNQKQSQRAVLGVWARQSPQELLEKVMFFPQELRQDVVFYALGSIARQSPDQAAMQLQKMEITLGAIDEQSVLAIVDEWVKVDPIEASRWAKQSYEAGSRVRARMMERVVYQLALTDAEEAIKLAVAEKPHSWHMGDVLETQVIDALVDQGELDLAIEMLQHVRESGLSMSFYYVGSLLIESGQSTEAIQLAKGLSEEKQVSYLTSLVYGWMNRNPVDLLNKISTLPSERAMSEVAKQAISRKNSSWTTLTDAQVERLQAYVDGDGVTEDFD